MYMRYRNFIIIIIIINICGSTKTMLYTCWN